MNVAEATFESLQTPCANAIAWIVSLWLIWTEPLPPVRTRLLWVGRVPSVV
jgi:hypothetical protein